MVETLKTLRRRIDTIKNTKQITRAMQMVAAAKFRRSDAAYQSGSPYSSGISQMMKRLLASVPSPPHPAFHKREVRNVLLVVMTTDRGLCGSFNTTLIKTAENFIKNRANVSIDLYCIGKKGYSYFNRHGYTIIDRIVDLGGRVDGNIAYKVATNLEEYFLTGRYDQIVFLYSHFITKATNTPRLEEFLPLTKNKDKPETENVRGIEYIFEPTVRDVFDAIVPRYLVSKLYITMAEHFTCEHGARMIAMTNASRNCDELVDSLTLKLNKARQAAITKELLDIVGGVEAM